MRPQTPENETSVNRLSQQPLGGHFLNLTFLVLKTYDT